MVYYLNVNGGLTAADLLSEVAKDTSVTKLENSDLFNTEFVQLLIKNAEAEVKIDDYVMEKIVTGLKECNEKGKIDLDYYEGLGELIGVNPKPEPEPVIEEEKVEVPEEEANSEE